MFVKSPGTDDAFTNPQVCFSLYLKKNVCWKEGPSDWPRTCLHIHCNVAICVPHHI